ncbi:MAG: hypothetical protein ABIX00_10310 [Polaromonas sp.]
MAALKVSLLGASDTQVSQLAAALNDAVKTSGWQALVFAGMPVSPADLASFDLVLLMGLEAGAESRIEALDARREAADQSIRATLALAATPYQVLYGASEVRLGDALRAIESLLPFARPRTRQGLSSDNSTTKPWVWMCEKCSDPQCEHRLLTALLAQRAGY